MDLRVRESSEEDITVVQVKDGESGNLSSQIEQGGQI